MSFFQKLKHLNMPESLVPTTHSSSATESSLTESNVEVERLFPRCLSSPKGAAVTSSTQESTQLASSSASTGKKKTKKKKAGSGAIKAKKVGSSQKFITSNAFLIWRSPFTFGSVSFSQNIRQNGIKRDMDKTCF